MTDFLKEVGTTEVARDSLNMDVNKPTELISTGPQNATSNQPDNTSFIAQEGIRAEQHSLNFSIGMTHNAHKMDSSLINS